VSPKSPVDWLRQTLSDTAPVLVVVDCLFDFTTIKENSANAGYSAIYAALGPVLRFAQDRQVHIALIHHASKLANQGSIDAALGSTGITGKPGTVLNYRLSDQQDKTSTRILSCSKHRSGDMADIPDVVLAWDPTTQTVRVGGLHENLMLWNAGISILEALKAHPDGVTQARLLRELDGRRHTHIKAIHRLMALDLIKRDGPGTKTKPSTLRLAVAMTDPVQTWEAALGDPLTDPLGSPRSDTTPDSVPAVPGGIWNYGNCIVTSDAASRIQFPTFSNNGHHVENPGTESSRLFSVEETPLFSVEGTRPGSGVQSPPDAEVL